ncbi:HAD hydrolase family protein [uncultured Gardnerella sp.]|uniref:HAD hydrolase family protein n=1 Tax=uncultured Gardnerella sp. TaxID=293424 RepID=UPI0025F7410C|nr:HAD hydrolase family protein [uncultured Gardnerella sp.]
MLEAIVHDCNEYLLAERIAQSSLIAFDLDNTLACSRQPMLPDMASILSDLICEKPIAIITGGCMNLVKTQILDVLNPYTKLENCHIMPTNGTRYYRINNNGELHCVYAHNIPDEDIDKIIKVIRVCAKNLGLLKEPGDCDLWGEQIENRGSQVTFSALGQNAPAFRKKAWDPSGVLKAKLANAIRENLPDFAVRQGGDTSVDVYCKGDDKAHALTTLSNICGIDIEDTVFIGDRMSEGGNDYPTAFTGTLAVEVQNPKDTVELCKRVLREIRFANN